MRSTRAAATAAAVLALTSVSAAGCSGGDASEPDGAATPSTRDDSASSKQKIRPCRVTAEVTGADPVSAEGKGRVVMGGGSGPDAFYEFTSDDLALAAYSEGPDFTPSVTLTAAGTTYSTLSDPAGLEIATDGTSAVVDASASSAEASSAGVQVVAEFTCR